MILFHGKVVQVLHGTEVKMFRFPSHEQLEAAVDEWLTLGGRSGIRASSTVAGVMNDPGPVEGF